MGDSWFAAKTSGRETRAAFYLERANVEAFFPRRHCYFVDKRTKVEKYRERPLFPGYIFFKAPRGGVDKVKSAIGVSYILGRWLGDLFVPREMPDGWIDRLIEACPIIEGRRKKFCTGEDVTIIICGIAGIVAKVESQSGRNVRVEGNMFGSKRIFVLDESDVEAAA